ncbi:MAG: hemerythrin domain-containing protein [Chitinispirillaceae bacterium]|nr:hemerythrin domain-containing protein [Chitinispirillaceae bacterium]
MENELFKQLKQEHLEVKQILSRIVSSPVDSRKNLFKELKINLLPHMEAEENAFYPVLSNKQDSYQSALEALEEHHVAKMVINEIENSAFESDTWLAKCKVLQDLLEHHIDEEESEIFELTRKTISEQQTEEIYNNFLALRNDYRGRMAA